MKKIKEVIAKKEEKKMVKAEVLMILKVIVFALMLSAVIYLYLCRKCGV